MSDVFQALAQAITDICSIDTSEVTPDQTIAGDLGIDSVDFLDIIYEMDKRYGIKIPLDEWMDRINRNEAKVEDYFTIGRLVRNIEDLVQLRKTA